MVLLGLMTFGAKVLELRTRLRMSQRDLAKAVGDTTASAISDWEKNGAVPSIDVGLRTARVLGVSLDYLADDSLDELPDAEPEPTGLTVKQQMVLAAMEAFGFEETWRRLHPAKPDDGPMGFKKRIEEG